MSTWLENAGPDLERALMEWDGLPPLDSVEALRTPPPKTPAWIQTVRDHLSQVRSSDPPAASEPDPLPDVSQILGRSMDEVQAYFGNPDITTTTKNGYTIEMPMNQGLDWLYRFYKLQPQVLVAADWSW